MYKAMVILAQFQLHFVGKKGPSCTVNRIELYEAQLTQKSLKASSFLLVNAVNQI